MGLGGEANLLAPMIEEEEEKMDALGDLEPEPSNTA